VNTTSVAAFAATALLTPLPLGLSNGAAADEVVLKFANTVLDKFRALLEEARKAG
jgi:hypothetical protein